MPIATALVLAAVLAEKPITYKQIKIASPKKYEINIAYPEFSSKSPLTTLANNITKRYFTIQRQEFEKSAKDFDETPTVPWELELNGVVSYSSNNVISIFFDHYEYAGGAHPNGFTHCINVAMIDGKPKAIKLTEILAPGVDLSELIEGHVKPALNSLKMARVNEPLTDFPEDSNTHFAISKNGLTFPFDKYSVGPYVEGEYIVKLKWSDIPGLINRKIIPEAL
ncbi:MAG: DUF3298 and DUF4163 domain-containing protein [Fimbriimonadaceae bacterium]